VALVNSPGKKRLVFDDSGRRIRAAQGHSIDVDLGYAPATPPALLYHGTAERNLTSIMADGLKPGARHDVHLSPDTETALTVGRRHGKPVILRVDAEAMARDGHVFHRADNGVWLTRSVPTRYLEIVT
jgi:putative RNA 2'-phosphotransferase